MDEEDSFGDDSDFLSSGVEGFPSLLASNRIELIVTNVEKIEDQLIVTGTQNGEGQPEIRLIMREMWSDTSVRIGYCIKVFDPQGTTSFANVTAIKEYYVDNKKGLVVVEPNVLVSSTTISQSFYCQRKAVLLERFRGGSTSNMSMLIGNCVHMLFQNALMEEGKAIDEDWLRAEFRRSVLPGLSLQMIAVKMTVKALENEIEPYLRYIRQWINTYVRPASGNVAGFHGGHTVTDVVDIEENNWMPAVGLKGKIDASLKVRDTKTGKHFVAPLELKTGKSKVSFDHQGQVLLYCMMLSMKKNFGSIESGFLLYLKDGSFRPVVPKAMDLKGIMKCRNEIAAFLSKIESDVFPEPLSSSRFCDQCPVSTVCTIYQRTTESSYQRTTEMQNFADTLTSHLATTHLDYFSRWTRWIMMEWTTADEQRMSAKSLWTIKAKKREEKGHCISSVVFKCQERVGDSVLLTFEREKMPSGILFKGDFVIVSTDYQFAITMGSLVSIGENVITLSCDKLMTVDMLKSKVHLDKHESFTTYAMNLANVAHLMENSERSNYLRRLIIDMDQPQRRIVSKRDYDGVVPILKPLNKNQAAAVLKAIFAKDFMCIEGFPGSGKTTTICALVQCMEKLGRSILITAYTNSAVDNIVRKLQKYISNDKILRLGSSNVHSDSQSFTLDSKLRDVDNSVDKYDLMKSVLSKTPIVATTCLMASSHSLFSWRKFDVCIVDEASLVTESTLLASLLLADTFVLVGDKQQLCPLVLNKIAREEGMSVSLFERLCTSKASKSFVISLNEQYRMNEVISGVCSTLFYDGAMKCGSDEVAKQTITMPDQENDPLVSQRNHGFDRCYSMLLEDSVVIVDTKSYEDSRYREGIKAAHRDVFNTGEAECVSTLCRGLLSRGVSPNEIGIMTTYRCQVKHIESVLDDSRVEVSTIDQYQGREKDVMLLSLVHTDTTKRCELLLDERRLNVALSRARFKLIVIGSVAAFNHYPVMRQIFEKIPVHVSVNDILLG